MVFSHFHLECFQVSIIVHIKLQKKIISLYFQALEVIIQILKVFFIEKNIEEKL